MDQAKCSRKENSLLWKMLKTFPKNSLQRNPLALGEGYTIREILVKTQIAKALWEKGSKLTGKTGSQAFILARQKAVTGGRILLKIYQGYNQTEGFHLRKSQPKISTYKVNHITLSQQHITIVQILWGDFKARENISKTNLKPIIIKWINSMKKEQN